MSNYISINIQACQPTQTIHHSNRSTYISYLVTEPNTITNYRHILDQSSVQNEMVNAFFELRKTEINQDYKTQNKRSIQKNTNLYQEAVISFGRDAFENNNIEDIQKSLEEFCNQFEEKYKVKILMSSLHLDEGHQNIEGQILHNYHAHILIENYSFETHKTGMRKVDYRKLQTELAESFESLGFKRGDPEKKAQRLEHKQYREMMEQKTELTQEIYQEDYEPLRTDLDKLKKQIQPLVYQAVNIAKEQNKEIKTYEDMTKILEERLKALEGDYKQAREELKATKQAKQSDYMELKKEFEQIKEQIKNEITVIKKQQETAGKKQYKKELQEQNPKLSKLITFPNPEYSTRLVISTPLKSEAAIDNLLESLQETAYKIQEIQTPRYVEKIIEFEKLIEKPIIVDIDENEQLKEQLQTQQNLMLEAQKEHKFVQAALEEENYDLKRENKGLKTAIERFLELKACKGVTQVSKSLVARFNEVIDYLQNVQERNTQHTQIEQQEHEQPQVRIKRR